MSENYTAKESRFLEVDLTKDEKIEIGKELAELHLAVVGLELEKGDLKEQIKDIDAKIKINEGDMDILFKKIGSGKEEREVECTVLIDYEKREKVVTRNDTGMEVERRPITDQEAQTTLEYEEQQVEDDGDGSENTEEN